MRDWHWVSVQTWKLLRAVMWSFVLLRFNGAYERHVKCRRTLECHSLQLNNPNDPTEICLHTSRSSSWLRQPRSSHYRMDVPGIRKRRLFSALRHQPLPVQHHRGCGLVHSYGLNIRSRHLHPARLNEFEPKSKQGMESPVRAGEGTAYASTACSRCGRRTSETAEHKSSATTAKPPSRHGQTV